jgi:hypothetical protein
VNKINKIVLSQRDEFVAELISYWLERDEVETALQLLLVLPEKRADVLCRVLPEPHGVELFDFYRKVVIFNYSPIRIIGRPVIWPPDNAYDN